MSKEYWNAHERHTLTFIIPCSIFMKERWARPTLQVVTLMRPLLNQAKIKPWSDKDWPESS